MFKGILGSILLFFLLYVSALAAIDLNRADKAALESIKGIGPAKANAIIKYRDDHDSFKCVDELLNIKGIGQNLLEKIRGQVTVSDE